LETEAGWPRTPWWAVRARLAGRVVSRQVPAEVVRRIDGWLPILEEAPVEPAWRHEDMFHA
jgi:hypothetical protein